MSEKQREQTIDRPNTRFPDVSPTDFQVPGEPGFQPPSGNSTTGRMPHDAPLNAGSYVEQYEVVNPYFPIQTQADSPTPDSGHSQVAEEADAEGKSTGSKPSSMQVAVTEITPSTPREPTTGEDKRDPDADLYTDEDPSAEAASDPTDEDNTEEFSAVYERNGPPRRKEDARSDPVEDIPPATGALLSEERAAQEAFFFPEQTAVSKGKDKVDAVERSDEEDPSTAAQAESSKASAKKASSSPKQGAVSRKRENADLKPRKVPKDPPSYRTEACTPQREPRENAGAESGPVEAEQEIDPETEPTPDTAAAQALEQEPIDIPVLEAYKDIRCPEHEDSPRYAMVRGSRVLCIEDTVFAESEPMDNSMFQMRSGDAYILLRLYGDLWTSCIRLTVRQPIQPAFPPTAPIMYPRVTWPTTETEGCVGFLPLCSLTLEGNYSDYLARKYKTTGLEEDISPAMGQTVKALPRTVSQHAEGRPGILIPIELYERASFYCMSKDKDFEPERPESKPKAGHLQGWKDISYRLSWPMPESTAKKLLRPITEKFRKDNKYGRYKPSPKSSIESTLGKDIDTRGPQGDVPPLYIAPPGRGPSSTQLHSHGANTTQTAGPSQTPVFTKEAEANQHTEQPSKQRLGLDRIRLRVISPFQIEQ